MNIKDNKKIQSAIIFGLSIIFILLYNLSNYDSLYTASPDGDLYISVAENFLSTSHFIQNVRENEINMVVPMGLPFIITICEIIFGSINGVLLLQYVLFGIMNVLLYNTIMNLFDSKILSGLAVLIYLMSTPVLEGVANPRYILTETYTLFITALLVFIISLKSKKIDDKLKYCLPILCVAFLIRSVFSIWLIFLIIIYVIRSIQKKIDFKYLLKCLGILVIVLIINVLINYREVGEFVVLQNYGGVPIYQANNPRTTTAEYSSAMVAQVGEEDFLEIYNNTGMTTGEKSKIFNNRAKEWIKNNPKDFIKNTVVKFYNMFVKTYKLDFGILLIVSVYMIIRYKDYKFFIYGMQFVLMAITTSIGLNIARYGYFALIFYIIAKMGIIKEIYIILRSGCGLKENKTIIVLLSLFSILFLNLVVMGMKNKSSTESKNEKISQLFANPENTFTIISSFENKSLEQVIKRYVLYKDYDVEIEYAGTPEIINKLNNGEEYNAIWISNSMWLGMLDDSIKYSDIRYTHINPIVFAIKKSDAEKLGLLNKNVYMEDISQIINSKEYKIATTSPLDTNLGSSAYLSLLCTVIDDSSQISEISLEDFEVRNKVNLLFENIEIIPNDEVTITEKFINEEYDSGFLYESLAISINKKLLAEGKDPLYVIYPKDGFSSSNSAFIYINDENVESDEKKENFTDLQKFVLSLEGKRALGNEGIRFWYGGTYKFASEDIFNPEWGIKTKEYITSRKYPNITYIKTALEIIK